MTPRASLCPAISRSTTRRNRSSSPSLMLPSIAASPFAPPRGPPGLALARSCRSSEQLPQAVRGGQCRTKEGCCKEPRKPPKLVLDAESRQYATTQGHDARRHKQPEIVKRARGNGALHQSALHSGKSERATSTGAALCGLSAPGEVVVKRASSLVTTLRRLNISYRKRQNATALTLPLVAFKPLRLTLIRKARFILCSLFKELGKLIRPIRLVVAYELFV